MMHSKLLVSTCLFCFVSVVPLASGSGYCSWTVNDFTFDISSLSGTTLSISVSDGDDDYEYTYTPCQNGVECETKDGKLMTIQQGNNCNQLAYWNSSTAPTYSDGQFILTYNPVDTRVFVASYQCGTGSATVESVTETTVGDYNVYTMEVSSKYACINGSITTTSAPELNCSWTTNNGYQLDLTSLYGSIVSYDTGNDSGFEYFYTPCRNGLACIQNDAVIPESDQYDTSNAMMIQADAYGACVSYLALFDFSVQPSYYPSKQSFVFNYINGEGNDILLDSEGMALDGVDVRKNELKDDSSCDGPRQAVIEWACNKTLADGQYEVQYVDEVVPCIYTMLIQSPLACGTNTTSQGSF